MEMKVGRVVSCKLGDYNLRMQDGRLRPEFNELIWYMYIGECRKILEAYANESSFVEKVWNHKEWKGRRGRGCAERYFRDFSSGFNLGIRSCIPRTKIPDFKQIFVKIAHIFLKIVKITNLLA